MISTTNQLCTLMPSNGLSLDIFTYNILINAHCKVADMKQALEIMNMISCSGCAPDVITYNTLINGLCIIKMTQLAFNLLESIVSTGFSPDTFTFNTILDGLCKDSLGLVVTLLEKLFKMGFSPYTVSYSTLLNHFCSLGMLNQAMMWLGKLMKIFFIHNAITYEILDNVHFGGKWSTNNPKNVTREGYLLHCVMQSMSNRSKRQEGTQMPFVSLNENLDSVISITNIYSKAIQDR